MNAKEAVAKRIQELCSKKNIALNTLANNSGVSPSTLYSIINEKSKNPGVVTIQKLCDGLGISVYEFFNSSVFKNLEPALI
jgi:transcriptional regulator with XRE-family HTH domain